MYKVIDMTEFAHVVNFTMSFGATVLPEDINKVRKDLDNGSDGYMLWNIELTKDSTDEEIANYLGLENYRDYFLTETINMEMEEHHVYDAKDTKRLTDEYNRKIKDFKEMNKK